MASAAGDFVYAKFSENSSFLLFSPLSAMILLALLSCFLVFFCFFFFQIASFQLKANHCVFERVRSFGMIRRHSDMCIPVICVSL